MSFAALLAAADGAALNALGGPVRYLSPRVAQPVDVTGMFDAAFISLEAGQAGVVGAGPAVWLRLSDLPTDPEMDDPVITVDGVDYRKKRIEKDGKGTVIIFLYEA